VNKNNLQQLLVEGLKDLYDAEKQITKALPKMASEAKTPDLRQAFEDHLGQTKSHVRRLEKVFEELKVSDREKECKGMQAIIQEGEEMVKETSDSDRPRCNSDIRSPTRGTLRDGGIWNGGELCSPA